MICLSVWFRLKKQQKQQKKLYREPRIVNHIDLWVECIFTSQVNADPALYVGELMSGSKVYRSYVPSVVSQWASAVASSHPSHCRCWRKDPCLLLINVSTDAVVLPFSQFNYKLIIIYNRINQFDVCMYFI